VGVYGVLAYLVRQRRPEMAIRMALGAARSQIVGLVATQGLIMGAAGLTLRLAASVALSRVVEGSLFGVKAVDPVTYGLASALLLLVVAAAATLPAWRAARVPPSEALRAD
jgi:ABC-type antimicrobial peptide transport system permease subunit